MDKVRQTISGLVVMVWFTSVLLPGQLGALTHTQAGKCHQSGHQLPSSGHGDYRCCLLGHHPGALPVISTAQAPTPCVYRMGSPQVNRIKIRETIDKTGESPSPPSILTRRV